MKNRYMGYGDFVWFIAKVIDNNDPEQLGRHKIRHIGLHDDESDIPDSDLPWAISFQSVLSPANQGKGLTPLGLDVGSFVMGFYLDGSDCQHPAILGSYAGIGDINTLATGQDIERNTIGPEPESPYAAEYPFNKVYESKSGHIIEIDDTPEAERIHIRHKTGSYIEIDGQGNTVFKSANQSYNITTDNKEIYVGGNVNIVVDGNANIDVKNSVQLNANNLTINSETEFTEKVNFTGGITSNGVSIDEDHRHKDVTSGSAISGKVNP